ncbi:hypothetical protein [Henriciella litoralis]|uniref:hypothetical protein n=1 Tax=Henriciella litoralis TaxID=568102 RepID=UPI00111C02C0|nr:hypothetical protein [Henriciella litoralis]
MSFPNAGRVHASISLLAFCLLAACSQERSGETGLPPETPPADIDEVMALPGEAVVVPAEWAKAVRLAGGGELATDGESLYAIAPGRPGTISLIGQAAGEETVFQKITVPPAHHEPLKFERLSPSQISISGADFSVRASVGAGVPFPDGQAEFEVDGVQWRVSVTPEAGTLQQGDVLISSHGPLGPETEALDALAHSPAFEAMVFAALDLACAPEAERLPPATSAALLLPLQLVLKHKIADRKGAFEYYAEASACGYQPAENPDRRPAPSEVMVSVPSESLIPAAFGYFPLDSEGALSLETVAAETSNGGQQ